MTVSVPVVPFSVLPASIVRLFTPMFVVPSDSVPEGLLTCRLGRLPPFPSIV